MVGVFVEVFIGENLLYVYGLCIDIVFDEEIGLVWVCLCGCYYGCFYIFFVF